MDIVIQIPKSGRHSLGCAHKFLREAYFYNVLNEALFSVVSNGRTRRRRNDLKLLYHQAGQNNIEAKTDSLIVNEHFQLTNINPIVCLLNLFLELIILTISYQYLDRFVFNTIHSLFL